MSHEMRTPLHGVLGLARMLETESLSPRGKGQLDLLQSTGEHLLAIINDILDFSRLQAKHLQLHPEATDVADLARRAVSLASVTASGKSIRVDVECALPPGKRWLVDPARLRQVLLNLLGNAVKFTDEGSVKLTVRLHRENQPSDSTQSIVFTVEDTGVGIPAEQISRIFDAFHQINNHSAVRAGTGLGLSIAQQLCADMGGTLQCESQVGVGSRFTFTLALPPAVVNAPALTGQSLPPTSSDSTERADCHVLVVDDNPVNLLVTEAQLARMGAKVTCVPSGRAALDWLLQNRADVILMDCHMPDMDGFEATQAWRATEAAEGRKPTPILALTASDDIAVREQALAAGMQGVLSKPFTDDAMLAAIAQLGLAPKAACVEA